MDYDGPKSLGASIPSFLIQQRERENREEERKRERRKEIHGRIGKFSKINCTFLVCVCVCVCVCVLACEVRYVCMCVGVGESSGNFTALPCVISN